MSGTGCLSVSSYIVPTWLLPVVKLCLWGLPTLASHWRFTALFGKGVCVLVYVTNVSSVLHQQSRFYTVEARNCWFDSFSQVGIDCGNTGVHILLVVGSYI